MSDGPDPDERSRPVLGLAFWAAMAVGLLFVLAGLGVAFLGPTLWPAEART